MRWLLQLRRTMTGALWNDYLRDPLEYTIALLFVCLGSWSCIMTKRVPNTPRAWSVRGQFGFGEEHHGIPLNYWQNEFLQLISSRAFYLNYHTFQYCLDIFVKYGPKWWSKSLSMIYITESESQIEVGLYPSLDDEESMNWCENQRLQLLLVRS